MVPFSSLIITNKLTTRCQKTNGELTKTLSTRALKYTCKVFRIQYMVFSVTLRNAIQKVSETYL